MWHYDKSAFFTFDLVLKTQNLRKSFYSEYQIFVYNTICKLRDEGKYFYEIADYLNENGYLTVNGKLFGGATVHSIQKKRLARLRIQNQKASSELQNFGICFSI